MNLASFITGILSPAHKLGSETGGQAVGAPLQDWARINENKRSNIANENLRAQEELGAQRRQDQQIDWYKQRFGLEQMLDYQGKLRQQQSNAVDELTTALATEDPVAIESARAKAERFGVTYEDEPGEETPPQQDPQTAPVEEQPKQVTPQEKPTTLSKDEQALVEGGEKFAAKNAGELEVEQRQGEDLALAGLTEEQKDLARNMPRPATAKPQRQTVNLPPMVVSKPANPKNPVGIRFSEGTGQPVPGEEPATEAAATTPPPEASTPAEVAPTPQAKRGYTLKIDGKPVARIAPESLMQRQRQVAAGAFAGVARVARTDAEKHAAETAAAIAADLAGKEGLKKAIEMGEEARRAVLSDAAAEEGRRAGVEGQMARLAAQIAQRNYGQDSDLWSWAQDQAKFVANQQGVDDINQKKRAAESTIAHIMNPNSVIQRAELMNMVDTWIKGVPSDKDMAMVNESAGKWNALQKEFNSWTEGGTLPQDWRERILEAQQLAKQFYDKKLHQAGIMAANATLARARAQAPQQADILSAYAYDLITGANTASTVGQQAGPASAGPAASPSKQSTPAKAAPAKKAVSQDEANSALLELLK